MKAPHYAALLIAAIACFLAAQPAWGAGLTIDNYKSGDTVRHSVVLLRGELPTGATVLSIERSSASEDADLEKGCSVTHEGCFKALVPLTPGVNRLTLKAGGTDGSVEFEIIYKPQTNPYYVRVIWMTDDSGATEFAAPTEDTPQDYEARLRTAALLMQSFTAERMREAGYGGRTFRLERDDAGEVIVHTWAGDKPKEDYYAMGDSGYWWNAVRMWVDRTHPDPMAKNIVLAAYTRKDPETGRVQGHTALGGANLGLFGSASVFSWPRDIASAAEVFEDGSRFDASRVNDDSAGRSSIWGLASTTIGATLHEAGHAFGLPHVPDGRGIMRRGFDRFNRFFTFYDPPSGHNARPRYFEANKEAYFAPLSSSYLRWSRWFQLDESEFADDRPRVRVDRDAATVTIACEAGVTWAGFHSGGDIHGFREYDANDPPKEVSLTLEEIDKAIGGKPLELIRAMSAGGVEGSARVR